MIATIAGRPFEVEGIYIYTYSTRRWPLKADRNKIKVDTGS